MIDVYKNSQFGRDYGSVRSAGASPAVGLFTDVSARRSLTRVRAENEVPACVWEKV